MADRSELKYESTYRGSKGRASAIRWLDGGFFILFVICFFVGAVAGTFLMVLAGGRSSALGPALFLGSSPVIMVMLYVLLFRRKKPPGYDVDLVATVQHGRDRFPVRHRLKHPLSG